MKAHAQVALRHVTRERCERFSRVIVRAYFAARPMDTDSVPLVSDTSARWYRYAHNALFIAACQIRTEPQWANMSTREIQRRLTGMVAALSAGKRWEDNINAAVAVSRYGYAASVAPDREVDKALAIMAGTEPGTVLDVRTCPKTHRFNRLCWNPDRCLDVCLDRWACRVIGLPEGIGEPSYSRAESDIWHAATDAINAELEAHGLPLVMPHEVQATLWVLARDVLKLKPGEYLAIRRDCLLVAGKPRALKRWRKSWLAGRAHRSALLAGHIPPTQVRLPF